MASSTWPDGSPRTVDDNEYEILGSAWSTDGIVGSPADTPVVYADSSGMQVKIRSGKYGVLHGKGWYSGSSDITKSISANASGQPRVDLVVLGLDRSTQLVTEYVKTGTPGSSPVPPALQRDAAGAGGTGKWEIPLARIAVASGAATISAGNVTVVVPWVGQGHLIAPDRESLDRIWTPTPGTTAVVGSDLYLYTAANGWRTASWNTSWGLIGGIEYTPSGAALAAGVGSSEALLNLSTGAVTTVTGRRYQLRAHFRHQHTASAISVFFLKENSTTGTQRGCYVENTTASVGYERHIFGEWSEASGSTRTFLLTGYNIGGTMTIYRTGVAGELAFLTLHDQGPGNNIVGPI